MRRPWRDRSTTRRKINVDLPAPGSPIMWLRPSSEIVDVGSSLPLLGARTLKTGPPSVERSRVRKFLGERLLSAASSASRIRAMSSSSAMVTLIGARVVLSGAVAGAAGSAETSRASQMTSDPLSPSILKRNDLGRGVAFEGTAHDALAQGRIDLQPALAPDPPDDVAELAVMDLLVRVFRLAFRGEGSAFLGWRGGLLAEQPDLGEAERSCEGGHLPLPDGQAPGQVGERMDAVRDIRHAACETEAGQHLHADTQGFGNGERIDDVPALDAQMQIDEAPAQHPQRHLDRILRICLCSHHAII
jgi:hypothetical protein